MNTEPENPEDTWPAGYPGPPVHPHPVTYRNWWGLIWLLYAGFLFWSATGHAPGWAKLVLLLGLTYFLIGGPYWAIREHKRGSSGVSWPALAALLVSSIFVSWIAFGDPSEGWRIAAMIVSALTWGATWQYVFADKRPLLWATYRMVPGENGWDGHVGANLTWPFWRVTGLAIGVGFGLMTGVLAALLVGTAVLDLVSGGAFYPRLCSLLGM